jgi:hypothetical protein
MGGIEEEGPGCLGERMPKIVRICQGIARMDIL